MLYWSHPEAAQILNSGDKKGATEAARPKSPAAQFLVAVRFADLGVFPNVLVRDAGIPGIPDLKRPRWVIRCGEKVSHALFPRVEERTKVDAKRINYAAGFSLGLIEGGLRALDEIPEKLKPWPKMREPSDEEVRKCLRFLFGENGDWLFEVFQDDGAKFYESVEEYESKLKVSEAADFEQGKADALKMIAGGNRRNDATDIYQFMLLYWRVVQRLESVDQLHQLLIRVFGRNRAGCDPKRVAQICQRVGLKYRARGRPRKQPQAFRQLR